MRREKGSKVVSNKRAKAEDKGERHLGGNVMLEQVQKSHIIKMMWNERAGKTNEVFEGTVSKS